MNFTRALVLTLLLLAAPASAGSGWYWQVKSMQGADFYVGPWPSVHYCLDMWGSALYAHPFACHNTGPVGHNCDNIGNGFMFPQGYPYPIWPNASADPMYPNFQRGCVQMDKAVLDLPKGWYFFFWQNGVGSVHPKSTYPYYLNLSKTVPGNSVGYYSDMRCPGAPFFSIGMDTACE